MSDLLNPINPALFLGVPPDGTREHYPESKFMEESSSDPFGIEEEKVLKAIKAVHQTWDEARQPHLNESRRAWALYNNQWDFSEKEDWQSQRALPKVTMNVERFTATMHRLMSLSKDWFSVVSLSPKKEKFINLSKAWTQFHLEHPKVSFFRFLGQAIKVGLLSHILPAMVGFETKGVMNPEIEATGLPVTDPMIDAIPVSPLAEAMKSPTVGVGEMENFLRLELINPHNILLDPSGGKLGVIVERSYTKAEFLREGNIRKWANMDKVLAENYAGLEMISREAEMKEIPAGAIQNQNVRIWDCWFMILPDEQGLPATDVENFFAVVANEKHFCVYPTENPFWHKECPIVTAGMIDVPFSVYHKSPVGISLDAIELWVDVLNMVIDYQQKLLIGVTEIDMSILHPNDEYHENKAIYPGKQFMKAGQGQLLQAAQLGDMSPNLWQFLQLLSGEIGEGTAMRDAQEGQPRTRSRMSAMEYTARVADAGTVLDFMFGNLQDNFIRPILVMAYRNTLQFTSTEVFARWVEERQEKFPDIAQELEELKKMSPRQRYDFLAHDMDFKCRVFSAVFDRQQEIEKVTFFAGVVGKIPMAMPHVKWWNLLKKAVEGLGYDAEEMISETPLVPYSEVLGGKPIQTGSDGGEATPSEPQQPGNMENQAAGVLGGSSGKPSGMFKELMPGSPKPGSAQ